MAEVGFVSATVPPSAQAGQLVVTEAVVSTTSAFVGGTEAYVRVRGQYWGPTGPVDFPLASNWVLLTQPNMGVTFNLTFFMPPYNTTVKFYLEEADPVSGAVRIIAVSPLHVITLEEPPPPPETAMSIIGMSYNGG